MNSTHQHASQQRAARRHKRAQVIKWTVYSLLLVNFFYYAWQEAYIAANVLTERAGLLDWTREFATTIDELGWFGLLIAFELETYALSDETAAKPRVKWSLHAARLVCYVMLAHTVMARIATVQDFEAVTLAENVTSLCQVADQGITYDFNYHYTEITSVNCTEISDEDRYYFIEEAVITDETGYRHYHNLVYVDLNDAVVWILVVWAIELAVWLQNRNITGGRLMLVTQGAKILYAVLWSHAIWWVWIGYWVWGWDQTLWIAGFWAIERNLSEWREDIRKGSQLAGKTA